MADIPIGSTREESLLVTPEVAIDFLELNTARVLSTPHLVGYLEMAVRNLIKELVGPEEDSVGTQVHLEHLAATPIGMRVRLLAEVIAVDNRRINCKVEAWDDCEKVAQGTHERFVINVARFAARVQAKAQGSRA